MTTSAHKFSEEEQAGVYKAIYQRRDMRHFIKQPVDAAVLDKLLHAAHAAPSVGMMQPWRFIRITDPELRIALHQLVEQERVQTAKALGEREQEFMRLKVEGMLECGELLVAGLMDRREEYQFGRRTLPEMDLASVACAIQNIWLAARAEGLGVGWVSLFEPQAVATLLAMPEGSKPVAILCVGHVDHFYDEPMLQQEGWINAGDIDNVLMENQWDSASAEQSHQRKRSS
ncbi:5,6-dimethylbenzimidazole synthase [Oceanicoccus sp. KOV_DT_Chl]|uniref:5,6-dimethylbenzimidazole synthase n=1 Tax=Oceanicoccus sp. KOV_DT_Chl TaxID=1904639 RepID=UPI000C7C5B8D|nr:5,6-dimethylbenzimidazole synthase [Oceanicoccus sp. KOV_DT_Chl]